MTKPVSRKMAVQAMLHSFLWDGYNGQHGGMIGAVLPCVICKVPLSANDDIQFDHRHAIVFDGPHEYQNLRPVHAECHKKKTARDIKANAKVKRIQKGGKKRKGPKMKSQGFRKRDKSRTYKPTPVRQLDKE